MNFFNPSIKNVKKTVTIQAEETNYTVRLFQDKIITL